MTEAIKVTKHETTRMDTNQIITRGILGVIASGGSAAISFLSQIEAWLRVGSLVIGIAVGIATLISILRKNK